jgi:hypothetical protein
VNGHDHVHQIECRWRPQFDFSPVASSLPANTEVADWFARVRNSVWPPSANLSAGVPETSVVYLTFLDGTAAVILRCWDLNAIPIMGASNRRPLVARVLVGSQTALTPQIAMAICLTGAAEVTEIPPGRVEFGATMPPISTTSLSALSDAAADALDDMACAETGLPSLIAAALLHYDKVMAVQLPPSETSDSARTAQVRMLWGLWRTTAPLLAGLDEPQVRGWSFSTYEPGLDSDTSPTQADIIFRALQPGGRPLMVVNEVTVTPRGPALADHAALADLANRLFAGFQRLGGQELTERLTGLCKDRFVRDERLDAVSQFLGGQSAAAVEAGTPAEQIVQPSAMATTYSGQHRTAEPALVGRARQQAGEQRTDTDPESGWQAGIATPASSGPVPAVPPTRTPAGPDDGPGGMAEVLGWLAAGPNSRHFQRAVTALLGPEPTTWREDRAAARRTMTPRNWYVPVLVHDNPWRVEEMLERIVSRIVVPDLSLEEVRDEVAAWVSDPLTPVVAVKALVVAAQRADARKAALLHGLLAPVVYRRWLAEHAVYLPRQAVPPGGRAASAEAAWPESAGPRPAGSAAAKRGSTGPERAKPDLGSRRSARRGQAPSASDSPEPAWSTPRLLTRILLWRLPASERTASLATVLVWLCVILVLVVVLLVL